MKKNYIPVDVPTAEQSTKMEEIRAKGYKYDMPHSISSAGVVLKHANEDFYFFGLQGEIMHNPKGYYIKA